MTDGGRKIRTGACAAALFLLAFSPLPVSSQSAGMEKERITFKAGKISVLAERADSPEKRSRGLMNRTHLGDREGMIFYFDESAYHAFWMYNTHVPLTVIFVDDRLAVADIQDMAPCRERNADRCPTYTARAAARYAIEVNQGFVGKYGVKIGDRVRIDKVDGR